jgi:hypothetical protein
VELWQEVVLSVNIFLISKCVIITLFMVHVASKVLCGSKYLLWENSILSWEHCMCDVQTYRYGLS